MDIHHFVELAESLHKESGTAAGLEAIESYSKGEINSIKDLALEIQRLQKCFPAFHIIVKKLCGSCDRIRVQDIYRLLHCAADRERMAHYLISVRADLKDDVIDTLDESEVAA